MTGTRYASVAVLALLAWPTGVAGAPQATAPPLLSTVPSPPAGATPVPAEMSGQPLQVGDLPPGVVAIRVIRRNFAANVTAQRVQLRVGDTGRVAESVTDTAGRAQFDGLRVGETVRATTSVDGEALDSRPFTLPAEGGVRVLLVAGVGAGVVGTPEPLPAQTTAPVRTPLSPGPRPWLERVTAAPVALTLFGIAGAAIMWSLRTRRPAATVIGAAGRITCDEPPAFERRSAAFELLVRLEKQHESVSLPPGEYAARRGELIAELIQLDADVSPN